MTLIKKCKKNESNTYTFENYVLNIGIPIIFPMHFRGHTMIQHDPNHDQMKKIFLQYFWWNSTSTFFSPFHSIKVFCTEQTWFILIGILLYIPTMKYEYETRNFCEWDSWCVKKSYFNFSLFFLAIDLNDLKEKLKFL